MPKGNLSVDEIKAVAEAAITAKHALDAAKKALEAEPEDQTLKDALTKAEQDATDTQAKADALSQNERTPEEQKRLDKMKRKRAIIDRQLRDAGELEEDDLDLDDDDELNRPVTFGDLQRIEREKATQTAVQMADEIEDSAAKKAVKDALARVVPSGDPQKDYRDAIAIASRDKNNKILEELGRKVIPNQHQSGSGAPPRRADAEFTPTAEEAHFMKPPFNLTKEDILKARPQET